MIPKRHKIGEDLTLKERCKLAVWMEQFQCAEVAQLQFKKEFMKGPPSLQSIEDIHHQFMTTGSVVSCSQTMLNRIRNKKLKEDLYEANSETDDNNDENWLTNGELFRSLEEEPEEGSIKRFYKKEQPDVSSTNFISISDQTLDFEYQDTIKDEDSSDDEDTCSNGKNKIELELLKNDDETTEEEVIKVYPKKIEQGFEISTSPSVSVLKQGINSGDQEFAEISVNEGEESFNNEEDTFSCCKCGYKTGKKQQFEAHQRAHSLKDFFRCSFCTFTSNSTSLLRSHKKICTGKNSGRTKKNYLENGLHSVVDSSCYTCDKCGKAYSSVASLKMHQAYHSMLRPFACDKCDYRFLSQTTLKKHSLTHDKIKHLECPHCSFKCNLSGNMIIHARTHTGEKPYKCSECPYRTGNPSVYKQHMSGHKNEIKFRCRNCHYKTHKSSLLANHERRCHSGFKIRCHICNEELRNSYALRYHMTKQHSEQEELECPFCDFRQKDKALLKIHIRRHTGEKPYSCSVENCNYRAIRSQDIRKHLTKEH